MKASENITHIQSPTWVEVLETESDLSNRLRQALLGNGIDPDTVERWIEEHDQSELLLRPISKQEIRISRMYEKELEDRDLRS